MSRLVFPAFAYFGMVFAAAFVFGIVRTLLVEPRVGELAAVAIELPFVLTAAWLASLFVVERWRVARRSLDRILLGGTAFLLLVITELSLGSAIFGRTIQESLVSVATAAGAVGLAGQLLFALVPLIQARRV